MQVHSSVQLECLLVICSGSLICFLEVPLLQAGKFLEELATDDSDVGSSVNKTMCRRSLNLHFHTLCESTFICHMDSVGFGSLAIGVRVE